jgi:hypothetical protein
VVELGSVVVRRASRLFMLYLFFLILVVEDAVWSSVLLPHTCFLLSCMHSMVETKTYPENIYERNGYPWVPTDHGPGGPCQVGSTCQKPHRPASGPRDLIHNPGDLGRPRMT